MLMLEKLHSNMRNDLDHLTDKPFKTFKCTKCKEKYYRMEIDRDMTVCPPCDNGKEPNEGNI